MSLKCQEVILKNLLSDTGYGALSSSFSPSDSGNYTCKATNELGDESVVKFELIVHASSENETSTGGASIGTRFSYVTVVKKSVIQ